MAYEGLTRVRGFVYDQRYLAIHRVNAKVISIGNLTAGGAGKTPVTLLLGERLLAQGKRVAIVSRGYGGSGREALVAADGKIYLDARAAGDEPVLLAKRLPGAAVLVGANRVRLAQQAISDHRAEVILLDDGFQHRRLARTEDVLVLGGARPLGNGALLPAGPLREPVDAAARATVTWLSNGAEHATLPPHFPRRRVISRHRPTELTDLGLTAAHGLAALSGKRVLLLAGLARPDAFRDSALAQSAEIVGEALFADHHRFTRSELAAVVAQAQRAGAELLLTTEKDAVRMQSGPPPAMETAVLRIDVEILDGDAIVGELCTC
jgi:tetraacyldisaccharide 4'-kinase